MYIKVDTMQTKYIVLIYLGIYVVYKYKYIYINKQRKRCWGFERESKGIYWKNGEGEKDMMLIYFNLKIDYEVLKVDKYRKKVYRNELRSSL